jgi:hypothetical protein
MTYFTGFRFALGLAALALGAVFLSLGEASAQTDAEQVTILSGFETAASQRTRTIIRTRRRGDRLVVDKWNVPLGGDSELDGGHNGVQASSQRASTGRSAEKVQNGVRVINARRSTRNVVRIR